MTDGKRVRPAALGGIQSEWLWFIDGRKHRDGVSDHNCGLAVGRRGIRDL